MDKIYQQAKDKNVANILVYVGPKVSNSENTRYACKDREGTIKMTADELLDACLKGTLFISAGDGPDKYVTLKSFTDYRQGGADSYVDADLHDIPGGTTNLTLVSSEYPTT